MVINCDSKRCQIGLIQKINCTKKVQILHYLITYNYNNTFAMSYMTDILNSMSMKVSSGYEILSFRMYQKENTQRSSYLSTQFCLLLLLNIITTLSQSLSSLLCSHVLCVFVWVCAFTHILLVLFKLLPMAYQMNSKVVVSSGERRSLSSFTV